MDMGEAMSSASPQAVLAQDEPILTHFYDLPQEVRDMIYSES